MEGELFQKNGFIAATHNIAKLWISFLNPKPVIISMHPGHLLILKYPEIKGLGDIYPAFLRSEILEAFFNSLFDGNHCCETADIKNFINVLI